MSAAARQARRRQRQRAGLIVLRVPVPEFDTIAALIEANRLSEAAALDRAQVEKAVGEVLAEWARRWRETNSHA